MSRSLIVSKQDVEQIKEQCTVKCIFSADYQFDEDTHTIVPLNVDMKGTTIQVCVHRSYRHCKVCKTPSSKCSKCTTRHEMIVPFSVIEYKFVKSVPELNLQFKFRLRNYQVEDLAMLLSVINTKGSCMFQAECGYGKTVMIAYLIALFGLRAIVIAPNERCASQNASLIEKAVEGCTVSTTKGDGSYDENADILVAVTSHLKGRYGLFSEYKLAIFDEIHVLSKPQSVPGMLSIQPEILIGFTATPEKKEELSRLFTGSDTIVGSHRMRWSIVYLDVPFTHEAAPKEFTKISTEMAQCEEFINMITRLCLYFFSRNKRVMILTERNSLRDSLTDIILGHGITVSNIQPNSKCKNADVIIGNKGMVGTGFDLGNAIDNFDGKHPEVVIFGFTLTDKTLFKQSAGRSFRSKYPLVIFPRFSGWSTSKRHVREVKEELLHNEYCTHRPMQERMLQYVADGVLDSLDPYEE